MLIKNEKRETRGSIKGDEGHAKGRKKTIVQEWWRSSMRHCATSRKVAGSIPNGVNEVFTDTILPIALWPWG